MFGYAFETNCMWRHVLGVNRPRNCDWNRRSTSQNASEFRPKFNRFFSFRIVFLDSYDVGCCERFIVEILSFNLLKWVVNFVEI